MFAALGAFGFFITNANDTYRFLITAGSGISLFITLGGLLALSSTYRGLIVNVRIVSGIFFIALLIEHIIFSFTGINFPAYIIITGILILLYILICYVIIKSTK
jgi:hypothetical protein